jgi:hypothetical protein
MEQQAESRFPAARHGGQWQARSRNTVRDRTDPNDGREVIWQCTENRGFSRTAFQSGFYLRYLIGRLRSKE